MPYVVDFDNVSTVGLESSPVAGALAGLRANEARYFQNKYRHQLTVDPADDSPQTVERVARILEQERSIELSARPLEATRFRVPDIDWTFVFYEDGLEVNVLYGVDPKKRAVGLKLSEGMDVPAALSAFKFARQRSKLAGTIRGSYFVIRGQYQ